MNDPLQIARKIEEIERQLERLKAERPKILADLFQAEDDGDTKTAGKIRDGLQSHDARTEATRQRKTDLEAALIEAIDAGIAAEIADLPQAEKLLQQEVRDVGREIGQLLARSEYLQRAYGARDLYEVHMAAPTISGGPASLPEGCEGLFGAVRDAKGSTLNELRGSDPNAESFNERRNRLRDTQDTINNPMRRKHVVEKRKAIITNTVRREMK